MDVTLFNKYEFFTGVPDSLLKPLTDWLLDSYAIAPESHIVAANEGNAAAIAAGYHLATGKTPVVYMQNSGIGNIINPALSLLSEKIYGIPVLFIVGWRGEPGVSDEPQHIHQGEVTIQLLEDIGIATHIISKDETRESFLAKTEEFEKLFKQGKSAAFIVRKGVLTYQREQDTAYESKKRGTLSREQVIKKLAAAAGSDIIVSTTGKASRELYEIREQNGQGHERDFLTVGSMGHCSSIAFGIAVHRPDRRVWVIDGDGAALMHAGAMAVIGSTAPKNLVHVVINNAMHESVGNVPTCAGEIILAAAAGCMGYQYFRTVETDEEIDDALEEILKQRKLSFLQVMTAAGSREDLGRPATTPKENKKKFMLQITS